MTTSVLRCAHVLVTISCIFHLYQPVTVLAEFSSAQCQLRCRNMVQFYARFWPPVQVDRTLNNCLSRCPSDEVKEEEPGMLNIFPTKSIPTTTKTKSTPSSTTTRTTTIRPTTTTTTTTIRTSTTRPTTTNRPMTTTYRNSRTTTAPTTRVTTTPTTTKTTTQTTTKRPTTTTTATTTTATTTTAQIPTTKPPVAPFSLQCGIRSTNSFRIAGGVDAEQCEFPWVVGITIYRLYCGGTVIDKRHVVTAAHCMRINGGRVVSKDVVTVRYGSSRLSELKTVNVSRILIHSYHVPKINDYDVAVLTLEEDLVYDDCVSPICLPEVNSEASLTDRCIAAGWGTATYGQKTLSADLQKVQLPIVSQNDCMRSYGSVYINSLKLCAGDYTKGGIDTCQGDSGGPLMCEVNGQMYLHGIVSFGSGCARAYYPGIYTRVTNTNIMRFIQEAVKDVPRSS